MKHWLLVLGFLVIVILGGWFWRYYTAPIEGRVGAQQQIQSAEQRITAYNYFFDLYGAIKSYDGALKALQEQLLQVSGPEEKDRVLATIAGLKGQKARAIEQYNVDARKSYTIGQFKDWSLPYQLENK